MELSKIDLEELFRLIKEYGVKSFRFKDGKKEIEVKTGEDMQNVNISSQYVSEKLEKNLKEEINLEVEEGNSVVDKEVEEKKEELHEIKAPLVGTFYRAPAPGAEPFVEIGSEVKPGDTLCIVEAMKNMNEIESDVHGIIKEICVENAQLVEFGQVLFKIKPL